MCHWLRNINLSTNGNCLPAQIFFLFTFHLSLLSFPFPFARSNTPKGCNAMYVGDVEDRSNTPKGCNAMLCMSKMSKMHSIECIEYCTKDQSNVEDRSNTPKGCNAMYVGDVEDGKRIYTHILAHNFLNT